MSWDAVTAISTAITAIVLAGTGIFIAVQAKELKRSAYAEAFAAISKLLDNEKARMARCTLMTNSKKDFNCWNQPEINDAEFVCSLYGSVGSMVRNKFISQKIIIDEWGYSIRRCYEHARPMIDEYRKLCGDNFREENYRTDFQWLYDKAMAYDKAKK